MPELHELGLAQAAQRIRDRKLSPVELVEALLSRIDALEPQLKAWVYLDRESVLSDAQQKEAELKDGERLSVSTGNLAAFSDTVDYNIETVGSLRKAFFSKEGLFMTRLTGPGTVLLQTLKPTRAGRSRFPSAGLPVLSTAKPRSMIATCGRRWTPSMRRYFHRRLLRVFCTLLSQTSGKLVLLQPSSGSMRSEIVVKEKLAG